MPAKSKKQQRFFGILKSIQEGKTSPGDIDNYKAMKEKADSMTAKQVDDFAGTKHKGLPEKKRKKKRKKKKKGGLSHSLETRGSRLLILKNLLSNSIVENH